MAKTKIIDVIVPELFAPYVINQTKELSNLINSGIAQSNPLLDSLIEKGGKTISMRVGVLPIVIPNNAGSHA